MVVVLQPVDAPASRRTQIMTGIDIFPTFLVGVGATALHEKSRQNTIETESGDVSKRMAPSLTMANQHNGCS